MLQVEAATLNCPMCGAVTSTDDPRCRYCDARLATVACPSCFAMMFLGSKHCPRCGAAAQRYEETTETGRNCPRCKTEMGLVSLNNERVHECAACLGLWLDPQTFERICAARENQSAVLGAAALHDTNRSAPTSKVTYIPCPKCSQLMNRANFARCSGVIVDLCKNHGIWFDRDELAAIIEFIRAGGLERSRAREKAEIEEERHKLQQEQLAKDLAGEKTFGPGGIHETRINGIAAAGGLLKFLLD